MAKVAFTKLGLSINKDVKEIEWNGQKIEVKQYLPSNEKLELCSRVINQSVDDNNYYNPGRLAIYQEIEILLTYTNINVTDKQREDVCKLFDLFSNGFAQAVYEVIPESEIGAITAIVEATIHNIYEFKNSLLGLLESVATDYSDLDLEADNIRDKLVQGDGINLLKDVMTKLA